MSRVNRETHSQKIKLQASMKIRGKGKPVSSHASIKELLLYTRRPKNGLKTLNHQLRTGVQRQKFSRTFYPKEDSKFESNDYVELWPSFFSKMNLGKTTDFAAGCSLLILYEFCARRPRAVSACQ